MTRYNEHTPTDQHSGHTELVESNRAVWAQIEHLTPHEALDVLLPIVDTLRAEIRDFNRNEATRKALQ